MRRLANITALTLALACGLSAADFSGIWVGQIPKRNNDPQDVEFKFTQTGTKLSGKLYGEYQSTPIAEGEVTGDQISFVVVVPEQSGNQINETRLRFTGTLLKDGEIELTREREGSRNAGNGGGVQFKGDTKLNFNLKRLL